MKARLMTFSAPNRDLASCFQPPHDNMPVSLNNDVLLEIFEWFVLVDDDGPFKVISLSKAWRSTALRCSRFWSRIVIDQSHKGWQQRVQKAVTLSQDRPLHLKIICRGLQFPHDLSQFQSSFSRIQTITSHASTKEQLKSVLHYLFANGVMSNIDKVEHRSSTDDPVGAVAIIYNAGIVNWLEAQEWLKTNDPEPLMTTSHPFIRDGMLPTTARSVFEVFIDEGSPGRYYCNWAAKGVWCKRWFKRRGHAIGHARIHLNYRPFACNGKCGSENCRDRFSTRDRLRLHSRRRQTMCEICGADIDNIDLTRHIRLHHRI